MSIFKTRKDVTKDLEAAQHDLADRKAKLTAAILKGDDSNAEKLSGEVARMEARVIALRNALPAAQEVDLQAIEAKRLAAMAHWQEYLAELDGETGDILKAVYTLNDRCNAILKRNDIERQALYKADGKYIGTESIAVILNTARTTNEVMWRCGMGTPDVAIKNGLKPVKV